MLNDFSRSKCDPYPPSQKKKKKKKEEEEEKRGQIKQKQ